MFGIDIRVCVTEPVVDTTVIIVVVILSVIVVLAISGVAMWVLFKRKYVFNNQPNNLRDFITLNMLGSRTFSHVIIQTVIHNYCNSTCALLIKICMLPNWSLASIFISIF